MTFSKKDEKQAKEKVGTRDDMASEQKKPGHSGQEESSERHTGAGFGGDSMAMEISDLSAYYGSFKALTDVSMGIQRNKVTAFIGSSGCGKSTFIRCLNRLHEVARGGRAEGQVLLDGDNIYGKEVDPVRVRHRVGMVFQEPNPFPTMSIYDNVIAGLKLGGGKKKGEYDEIVERTLKQAALWEEVKDKLKQAGSSLSGGQQQRLCIARTLAVEPEVILMDEPASSLDPISTTKIEDALHELKKDYTVAIVTHNMQQASRISDYTGFFYIEQMGDPGQLWEFDETEKMFSNPERQETEDYVTGQFG